MFNFAENQKKKLENEFGLLETCFDCFGFKRLLNVALLQEKGTLQNLKSILVVCMILRKKKIVGVLYGVENKLQKKFKVGLVN